jgi:hypothetical protein
MLFRLFLSYIIKSKVRVNSNLNYTKSSSLSYTISKQPDIKIWVINYLSAIIDFSIFMPT